MKSAMPRSHTYPARRDPSKLPYLIDWRGLLEGTEEVTNVEIEVIKSDLTVSDVQTYLGVTTFWLSGGGSAQRVNSYQAICTVSSGQTDAIELKIATNY